MNHGPTPSEIETAEALRMACPGRAVALTFETLARCYYAERDAIGRQPKVRIRALGNALGIDTDEVQRITARAESTIDQARRAAMGGAAYRSGVHRRYLYVFEDAEEKTVVREC